MVYKIKKLNSSSEEWLLKEMNKIKGKIITVFRDINERDLGMFISTTVDYIILYKEQEEVDS